MSRAKQIVINNKKQCTICKRWKDLGLYTPQPKASSGVYSYCKVCDNAKRIKQRKENKVVKPRKCLHCKRVDVEFTGVRRICIGCIELSNIKPVKVIVPKLTIKECKINKYNKAVKDIFDGK